MANLLQGDPLPNITTTQQQTTTAPDWYTNYLSNLSQQSQQAAANAQFVGATPLQQQAFTQVPQVATSYQPTLQSAINLASTSMPTATQAGQPYVQAAGQTAPQNVQAYMNPYTANVVEEIGRLGQRNINEMLAPAAAAAAVGSGQFGSQRGAQALGQTIRDALADIGTRQSGALNTGYQNAIQNAQTDLQRQMNLGQLTGQQATSDITSRLNQAQMLGALGGQEQQYGLAGLNALATLGQQQQQIGQNQQLFPLQLLASTSQNLRGYNIPTSVSSTANAPIPGAYATSPLAQIGSIGSLLGALNQAPAGGGKTPLENIIEGSLGQGVTKLFGSIGDLLTSIPNPFASTPTVTPPLIGDFPDIDIGDNIG